MWVAPEPRRLYNLAALFSESRLKLPLARYLSEGGAGGTPKARMPETELSPIGANTDVRLANATAECDRRT